MAPRTVQAAGGLLWRPRRGGAVSDDRPADDIEIALVHRPKYDDWSLPKGKLEPGEHPLAAALREVREETGSRAAPGRLLGRTRYVRDGTPKRVTYWAMRHTGGRFRTSDEVDRLAWVSPAEALQRVHPLHDRSMVEELLRDPRPTRATVVVRHAVAGSRKGWRGRDVDRPLDKRGRAQAQGLVPLLAAYGVTSAFSADVVRCVQTVAPWAESAGVQIGPEPLLSETGYAARPRAAARRLTELVRTAGPAVVCTQGGALPDVVESAARALGLRVRLSPVRKGALLVLHVHDGPDGPALLSVDQLPAP